MADSYDNIVTRIEFQYGVRAIASEAPGLYYLIDDESNDVGIMRLYKGRPQVLILTKSQSKKVAKEMREVLEVYRS